jgi:hypothetical protein
VSIRNRSLVDLSVMKRRPEVVAQTCAAADVCGVSVPAGCRCKAGNSFARGFRSVGGSSRLLKHVWGRPVVGGAVFGAGEAVSGTGWSVPGAGMTVSGGRGGLSWRREPPPGERVPRWASEARCPSVGQCSRVRERGTVSMMRSAQSTAASISTSGWQARVGCTFTGSRLVQMVGKK